MGGKALSKNTVRLTKSRYLEVVKEVEGVLKELQGSHEYQWTVLPYLDNKEDFGDMDILVGGWSQYDPELIAKALNAVEVVKVDKKITSLGIELPEGLFQIDLLKFREPNYHFAVKFYSYNDFNIALRVLYRVVGLTLKESGLYYNYTLDNNQKKEILITRDFDKSLRVIGLNPIKFNIGVFKDMRDVYDYLWTSYYFNPHYFNVTALNNRDRVDIKKRHYFNSFVQLAHEYMFMIEPFSDERRQYFKSVVFEHLQEHFPDFIQRLDILKKDIALESAFKKRFNGNIIKSITHLDGKELGLCMEFLMKRLENVYQMHESSLLHEEICSIDDETWMNWLNVNCSLYLNFEKIQY